MHNAQRVTLYAPSVTHIQQRVIIEQNFVNPTYDVKNDVQDAIWILHFFFYQILAMILQEQLPLLPLLLLTPWVSLNQV